MFATALATMVLIASANSVAPQWQPDYSKAFSAASEKKRPIAVFLGQGAKPADVNAANSKLLDDSYVCVYIDTTTDAGLKMAGAFEMTKGLVISDSTGNVQALRLAGDINETDLNKSLVRFSDPKLVVTTTATSPTPVVRSYVTPVGYPQSNCPGGNCPTGNCPNGRCPNVIR